MSPTRLLKPLLLACCVLTAAQAAEPGQPAADSLYLALGQREGLSRMMTSLVSQAKADARIGHFFKDSDNEELARQLTDQLCQVSGGPCQYKGGKMDKVHADMGVRKGDFNALVELLQTTMDRQGVPFAAQNRLLARLAPMHRDIIEPQGPPPAAATE